MAELIDPTFVAWSLESQEGDTELDARLDRVAAHYRGQAHQELERRRWVSGTVGLAAFHDPAVSCRWPCWIEGADAVMASAYLPVGVEPGEDAAAFGPAAEALAGRLLRDPPQVAERLHAPQALAIGDRAGGAVLLMNDAIGAGRLYEASFPGGRAWSNRIGALSLFSGVPPRADEPAWRLFAAAGWFLGESTPVAGVSKVPAGSVIRAAGGESIQRTSTHVAEALAGGGERGAGRKREAADAARGALALAARVFAERPLVDLSGGRDSRVSAAAAIAAGIDFELRTSDVKPGEAAIAKELVARIGRPVDHRISWGQNEHKAHDKPLSARARDLMLLHEGMRNPGRLRGRLDLPPAVAKHAVISGHGGEIAHGFYYATPAQLERLEGADRSALVARLMTSAQRRHGAAGGDSYAAAKEAFERRLDAGVEAGLSGPALLDWFYLMERFPQRSGVGAHSHRITVFSSPAFIACAFGLTPAERTEASLHAELIALLAPQWSGVPYFARRKRDPIRRRRIWEGADGKELRRMLREHDCWQEAFDARAVRRMLRRTRFGRIPGEWEQVFERVVCRIAFEGWAERLGALARE